MRLQATDVVEQWRAAKEPERTDQERHQADPSIQEDRPASAAAATSTAAASSAVLPAAFNNAARFLAFDAHVRRVLWRLNAAYSRAFCWISSVARVRIRASVSG